MTGSDRSHRAFDQRIAGYLALGWMIVERQSDPPLVRLKYRQRLSRSPRPSTIRDNGERVIWTDEAGEVRVERGEG